MINQTCTTMAGEFDKLYEDRYQASKERKIPESGLAYVRQKDFISNIDSLAETCSVLLKRIEVLEKLTEDQTKTIISFTEHTNALMERIERLENDSRNKS